MKKIMIILGSVIFITLSVSAQNNSTLTDNRDSKTYKTVKIGNQWWMAENLSYKTSNSWSTSEVKEKSSFHKGNGYGKVYGRLYTYNSAKNSCPVGWHLPSSNEWIQLIDNLGGKDVAAIRLAKSYNFERKRFKIKYSGFNYQFSGLYNFYSNSLHNPDEGLYWSSTSTKDKASVYSLSEGKPKIESNDLDKKFGFSVRCIKD